MKRCRLVWQRYLDNRPLISIPQRTIVWHPVNALSESEMYCYAYIEIHAARECRRLHDVVEYTGRR
jgi:hypothetical protein